MSLHKTYDNGVLFVEEYFLDDDDENLSFIISEEDLFTIDYTIDSTDYNKNRIHHNEEGPASIHYHKNGVIAFKGYMIEGKSHNDKGPAKEWFDTQGAHISHEYWLNDEYHTEEEYYAIINHLEVFE